MNTALGVQHLGGSKIYSTAMINFDIRLEHNFVRTDSISFHPARPQASLRLSLIRPSITGSNQLLCHGFNFLFAWFFSCRRHSLLYACILSLFQKTMADTKKREAVRRLFRSICILSIRRLASRRVRLPFRTSICTSLAELLLPHDAIHSIHQLTFDHYPAVVSPEMSQSSMGYVNVHRS